MTGPAAPEQTTLRKQYSSSHTSASFGPGSEEGKGRICKANLRNQRDARVQKPTD